MKRDDVLCVVAALATLAYVLWHMVRAGWLLN